MTHTIETRIQAARDELERLQQLAEDADVEASRCAKVFEREPSAEAHAEHAVAAQKAKNAHTAAAEKKKAITALEGEKATLEQQEIRRRFDEHLDQVAGAFDEAAEAFCDAIEKLDAAIKLFRSEPALYHDQRRVQIGRPASHTLEGLTARLNEGLRRYHTAHEHRLHREMAVAGMGGDPNHPTIRIAINRS